MPRPEGKAMIFLASRPRVYSRRPNHTQRGGSIFYGLPEPPGAELAKYLRERLAKKQKGGGVGRKSSVGKGNRRRRTQKRR